MNLLVFLPNPFTHCGKLTEDLDDSIMFTAFVAYATSLNVFIIIIFFVGF